MNERLNWNVTRGYWSLTPGEAWGNRFYIKFRVAVKLGQRPAVEESTFFSKRSVELKGR